MAELEFKGIKKEEGDRLKDAFEYIANAKRRGAFDESELIKKMGDKVTRYFINPTKEEADKLLEQWRLNPEVEMPWDFGSWFDALDSAEIDYQSIEIHPNGTGKILFEQLAWPSGGIDAANELVKAFGGEIISNNAI
ncbi:hypothetical protein [Oceanobacter mangrovi]|uniref:hypothetical protein n=1 Tax=Oceanobacter mangrovi TaxID=2862510 RepID=UPI001C8D3DFB|nr:hypothetical protein [Oceanobacter mangrovi]